MQDLDILYKKLEMQNGHFKKPSMVEVHLNPHELHELTSLQGSANHNAHGVPQFKKLWKEFLSHEPIQHAIHHHIREHKAAGGQVGRLENNGRFGDTRIASMPRPMVEYLENRYGKSINPNDGKPEFYLADMLHGAKTYMKPILAKIASGARYTGSKIASGARYAGSKMYNAGSGLYNRMPAMPFRGSRSSAEANSPRTWAQTLGPWGRSAGEGIARVTAPPIGRMAGMIAGAPVGRAAASLAFPYIPGMVRDPLAGAAGSLLGGPAGSMIAGHYGPKIGGHFGQKGGEIIGGGMDYLSRRMAPAMTAARETASAMSERAEPYVRPVARAAERGANVLGSALSTAHQYSPASLMVNAMSRNPELFSRMRSPSASSRFEEFGESSPLLGRPRSDSTESFVTARSGSPVYPRYALDLEPD